MANERLCTVPRWAIVLAKQVGAQPFLIYMLLIMHANDKGRGVAIRKDARRFQRTDAPARAAMHGVVKASRPDRNQPATIRERSQSVERLSARDRSTHPYE